MKLITRHVSCFQRFPLNNKHCTNFLYPFLEECLHCHCREIRQMFIFLVSLSCPKAYHRPYHTLRILEYPWRKQFWSWRHCSVVLRFRVTETIFTGTRTQHSFFRSFNLPKISSWFQGTNMPNTYIPSRAITEHTYTQLQCHMSYKVLVCGKRKTNSWSLYSYFCTCGYAAYLDTTHSINWEN
jgi:hypothetical protein